MSRFERARHRWRELVEPGVDGLPNRLVTWWFPLLATLGSVVFVAIGISGTSSGAFFLDFGTGSDPDAVLGGPRLIRSDEWLVQQSWIAGQAQQGFPAINRTFPGGMDATVLMELPTWDWSTLFRPHMWGYLLLGVEHGAAWQWWVPAIALVSGAYLLVVTWFPRRPLTAAMIAAAVWLSPIFQWWYGPNTIWPTAWVLLAITGTVWMLRTRRRSVRIVWAAVLGWLAVTVAIGLYVPFQLPPALVFLFVFIGLVVDALRGRRMPVRELLGRLAPLLVAGGAAIAVVLVWVGTRAATLTAVQSTVYPGARSDPSGRLPVEDPTLLGLFGAAFGQSFATVGEPTALGPNPSESATAIALAVFVLPGLVVLTVLRARRERRIDWVAVGAMTALLVVLAFLFVPGWDAVARLLLLDRVPVARYRVALAAALPVFAVLALRAAEGVPRRVAVAVGAVTAVLVAGFTAWLLVELMAVSPEVLDSARLWPVAALAIVLASGLVFVPRAAPAAAGALLVASLAIGAAVNPFYRGVYDLNDTEAGEDMDRIEAAEPGTWVGVGSYLTMALVMQTGVEGYNGVQTYPPAEMWREIDPDGSDEAVWNRLAHVRWTWGTGEPVFTDPQRDQILGGFDPCSDFAQEHVDYVVSDETPPDTACLAPLDDADEGRTDIRLYRVISGD